MRKSFRFFVGQIIRSFQKNRAATTKESNSTKLIKSLQGYSGIYDGKSHAINIITAENCKIEYSMDQTNWRPDAPSICNAGICKVYVKVSNNKSVEYGSAVINILKRSIVFTSVSAVKEYDGTPIKNNEVTISGDGIVDGEAISVYATGVQRLVGKCTNTIEYQFAAEVNGENYSITKDEGTLEVSDRKEKYRLLVKGNSAQFKYDGNIHEVRGFESSTFSIDGVEYCVCGINSYASLEHVGNVDTSIGGISVVVDADGNDVSDQFQVTILPGKLSVTPRIITVKSASDSQEYNGCELCNGNVEVYGDGFVTGEAPSFIVSGKQRLVGSSSNHFEYSFPRHVVNDDYQISVEYGVLEVRNRSEKYSIDIHMNAGEYTYDAKEHISAGIIEDTVQINGNSYSIDVIDEPAKGINAGSYVHETVNALQVYDFEHCDVTDQFDIHVQPGTLLIKKRELVLKSSSAVKEYDGTPLTNSSIQILGLADGDTIAGFVDGSQLIVGESRNSISYYFHKSELQDNYNVVLDEGTLEVIKRRIKFLITLEANSAEFLYDGTVHIAEGFKNSTAIINGNEYTVSDIQAYASLLHAGSIDTELSGKAVITDFCGNDVSDQFEVYVIPGMLQIHPREVTISSQSATKEYDGTALTASDIRIGGDGFVQNETPSIDVVGKQRIVGNCKNLFTYTFPQGVLDTDYRISVRYGNLRVNDRTIKFEADIHLKSGVFLYDANEHTLSDIEEESIQIDGNTFYPVVSEQPVRAVNVGTYIHDKVDSVCILDADHCDVSEQFDIHVHPGTLVINKRDLVLKSNSAVKEYDGIPLTDTSIQITGLADGDRITGFADGSQLVVGNSRNTISYIFNINELEDNYNVTLEEGILEVTDRKEKFQTVLKAKSAEYTYDGKIHIINELESDEVIINGQVFRVSGVHAYVSQRHAGCSETLISGKPVVKDTMNNDVTAQFDVQVIPGTIRINPRSVKLASASASREYNGSALRASDIEISGEGFVEGEEPSFVVSGEQRIVGHSANLFEYTLPRQVVPENYQITVEYGDLEVFNRHEKYSIDVRLCGGEYKYDAKEHIAAGIEENTVLVDGNTYTVEVTDELVKGIDAGNYIHDTVNEVRVYDFEHCDISEEFEVNVIPGTLIIYPRSVTISSASADKKYDGTDLKASDISITGDGFVPGEEPSVVVSGIQKQVGVSENTFSIALPDAVNKDNYLITTEYGKLTISPNPEYREAEDEKIDDYDVAIHSILNRMSGEKPSESLEGIKKYSRKELEALYEDTKELIVSDGKVLPFCEYLLEKKKGDSDIVRLHNRIVEEIQNVVLLSEIEISESEYRTLIDYARQEFRTAHIRADFVFPDILLSVAMIQIGIRKYASNYWPQVESVLGRKVGFYERKWLGNKVTRTLLSLGKPVYSETEYVTNILMHCIVTDSYALRFFDYLFSYYRLDLERDVSGLQKTDIDYICDSIINPYSMRKQMLSDYLSMSIRADKENCGKMIQKSLYMIDHSFWDEEISEEESLKGRMRERFNEWLEQSQFYRLEKRKNKHKIGNGNRVRLYRTPHLKVDLNKREFIVILPQQMIPVHDDTQMPEVKWFIISKSNREYNCWLEEGYSGYKTKEIQFYVEPDDIFDKAVFLLFADKTLIRSFSWDSHKAAFFTDNLDWVSGSKLDPGKAYAFCKQGCSIKSSDILYQGWFSGLRYYELGLKDGSFIFVQGEDNYYVGKVPNTGLGEDGIVRGVVINHENTQNLPIYSSDPQLIIESTEEQLPGTAIIINGQISRLADVKFVDVHVGNTSETKYYFISTHDLKGVREGYNKIIVDYPNSLKQLYAEYYKSADFCYEFIGAPYVFQDKGTLVVLEQEPIELEFSMSILVDDILEIDLGKEGTLYFEVPLLLTSWDRENWSYKKEPDIWHDDFKNMLYIRYPAETITLFVDGKNQDISKCSFNVMSDGVFNCDLTKMKSYFSKNVMVDHISLETKEMTSRLFRIILRSYFADLKMSADSRNNRIVARLKIIGKNDYYADLYCEDELLVEKKPIENGTVTFNDIEIETADYVIKLYESEGDFGFDDDYNYVGEKTCQLINASDLLGGRMKILSINAGADNELKFNSEYDYYIFPEKQISDDTYEAIVSGVFRNSSVMYASRTTVQIKDLMYPEKVTVEKANIKGEEYGLAYDTEKEAIIDCPKKQLGKNGYLNLDPSQCVWTVKYIGGNARLLDKSRIKMEETERLRNKPFTIWKN